MKSIVICVVVPLLTICDMAALVFKFPWNKSERLEDVYR